MIIKEEQNPTTTTTPITAANVSISGGKIKDNKSRKIQSADADTDNAGSLLAAATTPTSICQKAVVTTLTLTLTFK